MISLRDFFVYILIAIILVASIFTIVYCTISDDSYGYLFCEREGYDSVDLFNDGAYSKYFGKITCYSSFQGERAVKTFRVKREFGRFVKK